MKRNAALIGDHFSNIGWFSSADESDRGYRLGVQICFTSAVQLAEDLTALELSAPAGPIGQWAPASRWWDFHWSYELEAREMIGGWGMLNELPHWSLMEGSEDAKKEIKRWPGA